MKRSDVHISELNGEFSPREGLVVLCKNRKKLCLELGLKNACIVVGDEDNEHIVLFCAKKNPHTTEKQ